MTAPICQRDGPATLTPSQRRCRRPCRARSA